MGNKVKAALVLAAVSAASCVTFLATAGSASATVDGYEVVKSTPSFAANTQTVNTVLCPTGKVAIGGGYGPSPYYNNNSSFMVFLDALDYGNTDSARTWDIGADNHTAYPQTMDIFVVCASN